jgi:hypothetical protein
LVARRRRLHEVPAHVAHFADEAFVEPCLHLRESRQRAAVVRHEQREPARLERGEHARAFGVVHRHRLLDAAGLACLRDAQCKIEMACRRRCDVHGIHLAGRDELVDVLVHRSDAVTCRVVARGLGAARGDGDQRCAGRTLEGRTALDLGHRAAADHSPADRLHSRRSLFPCAARTATELVRRDVGAYGRAEVLRTTHRSDLEVGRTGRTTDHLTRLADCESSVPKRQIQPHIRASLSSERPAPTAMSANTIQ